MSYYNVMIVQDLSDYDDTKKKNGELKSLSDGGDKGGDNSLEEEEEQQTQEQSHEAKELANVLINTVTHSCT